MLQEEPPIAHSQPDEPPREEQFSDKAKERDLQGHLEGCHNRYGASLRDDEHWASPRALASACPSSSSSAGKAWALVLPA